MKRMTNLYNNICNINNIIFCYNEVRRHTRNPRKVAYLRNYKSICISSIQETLLNHNYIVGPYTHFVLYEPKKRNIVSQGVYDKIVNHLVARYILYPAILPCLLDVNVASRKNMGTSKGLELATIYHKECKRKYGKYYILKCDISKFFASIDHDILKQKILRRIKDKDAIKIVFDIIDSNESGLYIGSMTSQILAIFFLNDLDHYIKEELKIQYFIRYQDDFLLFHNSKKYLKYCLEKIKEFVAKEKLTLNTKTRIYKNTDNFIFLGRNKYGKYSKYRGVKKKLSKKYTHFVNKKLSLNSLCCSIINYKHLCKKNKLHYIK